MLNIVLFGPQGAGKGTQSQKLIDKYNLIHLSTGDLLRSEIAAGTELGLRAKSLMDNGLLVPDEDAPAMAAAMLRLMDSDTLRRSLGEAGQALQSSRFSIAGTAGRYQQLYEARP